MNDIMNLIDQLEEIIDGAKSVPLSSNRMVNPTEVFDIIDEIRDSYPEDLKQARFIVRQEKEIKEEAEAAANRILEEAQDRARALIAETEVVRAAESRAAEIMEDARANAREIRLGADDYASEIMANLEVNLGKLLTAVQRGRDRLEGRTPQR